MEVAIYASRAQEYRDVEYHGGNPAFLTSATASASLYYSRILE